MADFEATFATLRGVLDKHSKRLRLGADTETSYSARGRVPSPFPQHKGKPMWFGEVRLGKAYVSFHLMPLYMNPALEKNISVALKKRMQGKACFNFTQPPEHELLCELERLTDTGIADWTTKGWI